MSKYQEEKISCICEICSKTIMVGRYRAKKWTKCLPCSAFLNGKNNIGIKHTEETNRKNSERNSGEGNGFFGKTHSEETLEKFRNKEITQKVRDSAKESMKRNSNKRPIFDIWVEKFGIEGALAKKEELRKIQSINSSGENNPMYGKPSPMGSGNGWSGWYREVYFRSILELSYMHLMYNNDIILENGELLKHGIPYIFEGNKRTYFPDFFLPEFNVYIEIKPKNLIKSLQNCAKIEAATKLYGNKFIVLSEFDFPILQNEVIKDLYEKGIIRWLPRYEEKYRNFSSDKGVT
jgi:hypothetical protein